MLFETVGFLYPAKTIYFRLKATGYEVTGCVRIGCMLNLVLVSIDSTHWQI